MTTPSTEPTYAIVVLPAETFAQYATLLDRAPVLAEGRVALAAEVTFSGRMILNPVATPQGPTKLLLQAGTVTVRVRIFGPGGETQTSEGAL
jgi:hypothetical protein